MGYAKVLLKSYDPSTEMLEFEVQREYRGPVEIEHRPYSDVAAIYERMEKEQLSDVEYCIACLFEHDEYWHEPTEASPQEIVGESFECD